MITDSALRQEVKALKAFHNVKYKTISELLGIKPNSFYGWLKDDFKLSDSNKRKLEQIVNKYKE